MLTQDEIERKLKTIKKQYEKDGIAIIGFFGSYARGDATEQSDLDILIETKERFVRESDPFGAFSRLREIKEQLQILFQIPVDIADRSGLHRIAENHILKELHRV